MAKVKFSNINFYYILHEVSVTFQGNHIISQKKQKQEQTLSKGWQSY